jgi:hypothetical protein
MDDPMSAQATAPLPATPADIAWLKERVGDEPVDQRIASGRFVIVDEEKGSVEGQIYERNSNKN